MGTDEAQPVRAAYARSAVELRQIIQTERLGQPFLIWRSADGAQQIVSLEGRDRLTVGRRPSNDVVLEGDGEVSRLHGELERLGDEWAVSDDGLSHNGTYVNGIRISRKRRLGDGDTIRFGRTVVEYRCPSEGSSVLTSSAPFNAAVKSLTETQRRILIALCRPYRRGEAFATPATNHQIASEVFLSVDAVKMHLRTLFQRFEIGDLPQNQKRARLVECAFQWGLVSEKELE
jgi:pSer/pThr/pTyr-binding forkhead associated (FHA) protein